MPSFLLPLVLLACAPENGLAGKDHEPGFDTGDPPIGVDDTSATLPAEECNGLDDDGDGRVDEDFPDDDGNGRADCMDAACPDLALAEAGSVAIETACEGGDGGVVPDPWSVVQEWTFTAPASAPNATASFTTPSVGDLDGDGTPEVVIGAFGSPSAYVAIDGATGAEEWSFADDLAARGPAVVADIDADGATDVVAGVYGGTLYAFEGDGTVKWTSTVLPSLADPLFPVAADLDADGMPEILLDDLVLDGATGALETRLALRASNAFRDPVTGDVDGDGDQEIALDGQLFDSDGSLLWDSGEQGMVVWSALVQADADPDAEVAFVGNRFTVWDADGTRLTSVDISAGNYVSPPCAGDFDGDGTEEIAFAYQSTLYAYELDGTVLWSVPSIDVSGAAGCTAFDVDGDGALEVLFGGEVSFGIYDGRTGAAQYLDPTHGSGTSFETPAVADVDGDGSAEILVVETTTGHALVVYGQADDAWPPAGPSWSQFDFSMTQADPDGSVPAEPVPYWSTYGVFRGRLADDDQAAPDLAVAITDQCIADCDYGPVQVAVAVWNQGARDVDAGQILSLYADDDEGPRLVATATLPAIPAGTQLDGILFELTAADIGAFGWIARVDEAGAVRECDETNDEDAYTDATCL